MRAKKPKSRKGIGGPKPKYKPELCRKVKLMARSGMIDEEIAEVLGISLATYYRWQNKYPEFRDAIKSGKEFSDDGVEDTMYRAAKGYEVQLKEILTEDVIIGKDEKGKPIVVTKTKKRITTKYVQPNVLAGIFILKNRQRGRWGGNAGAGPEELPPPGGGRGLPGDPNQKYVDKMLVARDRLKQRKQEYLTAKALEAAMVKEAAGSETIEMEIQDTGSYQIGQENES